jgi:hypothetical protein
LLRVFIGGHRTVDHSKGKYVRDDVHTNTVENFFSIFKRGLFGTYQHISEKHLGRYLAEFDFRYNQRIRLGVNDQTRADKALRGISGKRLTYATPRSRWSVPSRSKAAGGARRYGLSAPADPRQLWLPFIDGDEQ